MILENFPVIHTQSIFEKHKATLKQIYVEAVTLMKI
jgi:hypothetical protein